MPNTIAIQSADDPRLEPYRSIRERDLAGREGLFIAEGRVVLEKAIRHDPAGLISVLVAEPRLAGLSDLLGGLPAATPVYVAGQGAMDQVVGFPIHRGILAMVKRQVLDAESLIATLPARALVVGLIGIANHDNMGGILRNAAAFGVQAVLVDETCCDHLYRKAIRVSVGAALTLPVARVKSAAVMIDLLSAVGFEVLALSPGGLEDLLDVAAGPRTALLMGAEGPGLPDAVLALTRTVRITMAGGFDSLNVGTTSGIVLHRLTAGR